MSRHDNNEDITLGEMFINLIVLIFIVWFIGFVQQKFYPKEWLTSEMERLWNYEEVEKKKAEEDKVLFDSDSFYRNAYKRESELRKIQFENSKARDNFPVDEGPQRFNASEGRRLAEQAQQRAQGVEVVKSYSVPASNYNPNGAWAEFTWSPLSLSQDGKTKYFLNMDDVDEYMTAQESNEGPVYRISTLSFQADDPKTVMQSIEIKCGNDRYEDTFRVYSTKWYNDRDGRHFAKSAWGQSDNFIPLKGSPYENIVPTHVAC